MGICERPSFRSRLLVRIPDVVVARRTPLRFRTTLRAAVDSDAFKDRDFFSAGRDGLSFATGFFVECFGDFFLADRVDFFAVSRVDALSADLPEVDFFLLREVPVVFVAFFFAGFFFDIVS